MSDLQNTHRAACAALFVFNSVRWYSILAITHYGEGTSLLVPLGSSVMTALAAEGQLRGYKSTSGAEAPSFIDLLARLKPCPSRSCSWRVDVAATHDGESTSLLVPLGSSVMTALAAEGSRGDPRAPQGLKHRSICDMFGTHSTPLFHSVAQGRL